jgi:hypothetical protein
LKTIEFHYEYAHTNEPSLEPLLTSFEVELGGTRQPFAGRAGAIDLVTVLELVITFVAGVAVQSILEKYFEGLFHGEAVQKLGEDHRKQILSWLSQVRSDIAETMDVIEPLIHTHFVHTRFGEKYAIALVIPLGRITLYAVLNHAPVTEELLRDLPNGIIKAIRFVVENTLPEDAHSAQLYFDRDSREWKYLLVPTANGFGRWVDRYIDLVSGAVKTIGSRQEFHKVFRPESADEYRFLVSPFIEPRR